jgi:DNA polymerase-3 subunit epsilon
MIHQLLSLTRPLFVIDCETTGTDVQNDRIIELGFQQWTSEGLIKEWRSLIRPGIPIPAAASHIHHITDEMVNACKTCEKSIAEHTDPDGCQFRPWPYFKQIADNLLLGFKDCDFAGKHVRFDIRMVDGEMTRAGYTWDAYLTARIIDAERLEALAEPRSLSNLHKKYTGAVHDGAHGALSDVRATTTVLVHQLQQYDILPRNLDHLHRDQWRGWICNSGHFKMVDGIAICAFGKRYNGVPMHKIPMDFYDWVLKNDFPTDVKFLARNAKLGKFPT